VPLDFIPGVGKRTIQRLIDEFGTEMAILHEVSLEELGQVVPGKIAKMIDLARKGELNIERGGGGVYGKVVE
jgi:PHP family Zn ribbon phosphoesterase